MTAKPERRGAPRIASELPLAIAGEDGEFVIRTKNLSASGAYCSLRRAIAPMTKLRVRLELPGRPKPTQITCQGIVVRVETDSVPARGASQYHVAILFSELTDHDRSTLAHYVQQHLRSARSRG